MGGYCNIHMLASFIDTAAEDAYRSLNYSKKYVFIREIDA